MKKISLAICLQFLSSYLIAQTTFASWNKATLTLNNGIVERIIQLPAEKGSFITTSYKPVQGAFNYFQKTNSDFQFEWNDKLYSGRSSWKLLEVAAFSDKYAGNGAAVRLLSEDRLGDPRKLSPADFEKYRAYADWLQDMENKYSFMGFRQDLPGFGEPMEAMWDGYQRINTANKSGGIIGVFRHGSVESKRIVSVKYLDPAKNYSVKTIDGKTIVTLTGLELESKGFSIEIADKYGGELLEVSSE